MTLKELPPQEQALDEHGRRVLSDAEQRRRGLQSLVYEVRRRLPFYLLLVLLFFIVIAPILMLVYASLISIPPRPGHDVSWSNFTLSNFAFVTSQSTIRATLNSLTIGLFGTLFALIGGGALAWLAARTDVPGRPLVQLAGIVPMFVSPLVGALAWSFIGSPARTSYANLLLEELGINFAVNIYSIPGIIFVFSLYYIPYAFLFIYSALTLMNPELEEVARVHGATVRKTASFVTFPLVAPAILGSGLLTFVLIIENFPVPQVLGTPARINTLPSFIFNLMNTAPSRPNEAAGVGLLLMLVMSVVIWIQRRIISAREYATVTGKGFRPRMIELNRWRWPAFSFVLVYIILAVVLPFFALFQMAFRRHSFIEDFWGLFDTTAFTTMHFMAVLDYSPFRIGFRNSIVASILTAFIGGALHLGMAYTVYRTKTPGRQYIEYIAMLPLAAPALVLGIGFLWTWLLLPFPLYGTLGILVVAFSVRFMPQGFRSISSSILQVHRDLEESAFVAGATRTRTTMEITVPLIRSGVVSTMVLLLILSMRELSAAIFLFTSSTRVLSVVIFDLWFSGVLARAAAVSLIYAGLLLVIVMFARRYLGVQGQER
jgi:iron(III) transport system permease protein